MGRALPYRRIGTALLLVALFAMQASPAAAGEPAPSVLIDDPLDALGDDRPAIEEAAADLRHGLIISVVPSLEGRPSEEVVAQRFAELAPGVLFIPLLLLAVDERVAVFAVEDPDRLREFGGEAVVEYEVGPLLPASSTANEAFTTGDAGTAALAGIAELSDQYGSPSGQGGGEAPAIGFLTWLVPVFVIVGLINLGRGVKARRRLRALSGGATAVRDLAGAGTTTLAGIAQTSEPLLSPVTETPCVYWEFSVEEDWRQTRIETTVRYVDSTGRDDPARGWPVEESREVEAGRGTKKVGGGRQSVPFQLRDDTGEVLVFPDRAEIVAMTSYQGTVDQTSPYFHVPSVRGHVFSTGVRHLNERIVPVDAPVTVVGPVEFEDGNPQVRWTRRRRPGGKHPFLVTTSEPGRAERSERWKMIRKFAVAGACLAGIVTVLVVIAVAG